MTLNDGMSKVLRKINNALEVTLNSFEQVQRASGNSVDVEMIERARAELAGANRDLDEMAEGYRRASQEQENLNDGLQRGTGLAGNMLGKITALAGAYIGLGQIKSFVQSAMEDATEGLNVSAQLSQSLANMGLGREAYDAVSKAADKYRYYGQTAFQAAGAEFATYLGDDQAIISMMDTLSNYAVGMSGGGELDTSQIVDYATQLGKVLVGSYDGITKKGFELTEVQKQIIENGTDMEKAAVIADVINESWGNLYDTMSNTPAGRIQKLNVALGEMVENVGYALYPAVMNLIAAVERNLPFIEQFFDGVAMPLGTFINMLSWAVDGVLSFGAAFANSWADIAPFVYGLAGVLGVLALYKTGVMLVTVAQKMWNAATLASPITWIVIAVASLVFLLIIVANQIAKTSSVATSAFGVITGGINVVIMFFVNLGLTVANVALGIWSAMGAAASNMSTAFSNAISSIQGWFYNLMSTVLSVVGKIAQALNSLPFVSFDYSGLVSAADSYAAKSAEAYGNVKEYESIADAFSNGSNTFDAFGDGWAQNAFRAGADWGDGVANKVGGLFSYTAGNADDLLGSAFALDGLANDVSDIADSSAAAAGALSGSNEELKYLREIAERQAINQFTTAEINVTMNNSNQISSDMDIDGIIGALEDRVEESMIIMAEEVHV